MLSYLRRCSTYLSRFLGRRSGSSPSVPVAAGCIDGSTSGYGEDGMREQQGKVLPVDGNLLKQSGQHFQMGEWQQLVKLSIESIETHPDRAKLALLAAAGLIQEGKVSEAERFLSAAREWGCQKDLISRVLISGVHHSLGRAGLLAGHQERSGQHFEEALFVVQLGSDYRHYAKARYVLETARLGQIPHSVELMDGELKALQSSRVNSTQLKIFRTELSLVHHELSIAQRRKQLDHHSASLKKYSADLTSSESLESISMSQLGQDVWVLEKCGHKRGGFFVEFGATDGVLLSNTWMLEKEFSWKGICAEPNQEFFTQLKMNRACTVSDDYIGGNTGTIVEFILAGAFGGSVEFANDDMHREKRDAYRKNGDTTTFVSISLGDFLKKYNAPKDIDYISIDTEGSEFEILRTFDFDAWNVRLWTIEHNFTERRKDIRKLFESHGYKCTESQWDDWYEKTN